MTRPDCNDKYEAQPKWIITCTKKLNHEGYHKSGYYVWY
jgi:hypothetical protein